MYGKTKAISLCYS